jgi:lipoprotein-anchoring transpeptidase ErfK/SrfK
MEAKRPMKSRASATLYGIVVSGMIMFFLLTSNSIYAASSDINWLKPTGGLYPKLSRSTDVWIKVSLECQTVKIMNGERSIYTMIASTGLDLPSDDRTPQGVFHIQRERGISFYSSKLREGARYWVSWLNHGEYLFHSVPTDSRGRIIADEARKLGRKASHGCIRLALPDAKWLYENIPCGAKVVIGP